MIDNIEVPVVQRRRWILGIYFRNNVGDAEILGVVVWIYDFAYASIVVITLDLAARVGNCPWEFIARRIEEHFVKVHH